MRVEPKGSMKILNEVPSYVYQVDDYKMSSVRPEDYPEHFLVELYSSDYKHPKIFYINGPRRIVLMKNRLGVAAIWNSGYPYKDISPYNFCELIKHMHFLVIDAKF